MANIKYQIFVSSTYVDLTDERLAISRAVLDLGHIPAGMELFPAADIEQLEYIKRVIDECDYYILILGARYGSVDHQGVSYTEREYDYAVKSGKPVLAFIHSDVDQIALGKTDKDAAKLASLDDFRNKVCQGRLVQQWNSLSALTSQAIISLSRAFATQPQVGWVRADQVPTQASATDMLRLREEVESLRDQLAKAKRASLPVFRDAAGLDEKLRLDFDYFSDHGKRTGHRDVAYHEFLVLAAPALHNPTTMTSVIGAVTQGLRDRYGAGGRSMTMKTSQIQDALLHLTATGHIKMWSSTTKDGTQNVTGYQLTPSGAKEWQERSYKKREASVTSSSPPA